MTPLLKDIADPAQDLTDEQFDSAQRRAAEELASFAPGKRESLFEGISDDEAGRNGAD
jgi:hypothetical protein